MSKEITDEKYNELIKNLICTFPEGDKIDLINAERDLINAENALFSSLTYEQCDLFYKLRDARKRYYKAFIKHIKEKT